MSGNRVCGCGASFVYIDDETMRCTSCGGVFRRRPPDPAPLPPDPEERIADALESIAESLRRIAYPDQWLDPPERPEQSIAASLQRLAGCVQTSTYLDGSDMLYLRTEP